MKSENNMHNRSAGAGRGDPGKQKESLEEQVTTPAGVSKEAGEAAGNSPADSLQRAEDSAINKLQAEKQELFDRLLRKQAELENFRKRVQREKEEFLQHANAELVRSLLPVLDGFDRALKHRNHDVPSEYYVGLELIHRQLTEALGRAGLTPIEAQGKLFDPELHQAAEKMETKEHRDQEVVEELQRGYTLRHRLLRPAVVKVAVHPPELSPRETSE